MGILSDVHGLVRLANDLKPFLREPLSVEGAKAYVRERMCNREALFLRMVDRAIFANPRSPYLELFRLAGCELGDVSALVKKEGVEGTLEKLLQAGIYVTFEEFKGRAAARRGSRTFEWDDTDFDNPSIRTHFRSTSGGTQGTPSRVKINLEYIGQSAPHWALWFAAHDRLASPVIFWTPIYAAVVNRQLMCAKFGRRLVRWFSSGGGGTRKARASAACIHGVARWAAHFPKPEFVPPQEAGKVGEYLVGLADKGERPCVVTTPSAAVRISLVMQQRGVSLRNVMFLLGGEPLTRTRRETIEACGAKAVPTYGFSEGGSVGSQCPNPAAADDIHISLDAYAVILRARTLSQGEPANALLLTALRPASPKILLNTEIGDSGTLETRQCGCLFDELGYFRHLHTIRSFEKLTGEGVTFVGGDLFRLMEEILPKRFGGTLGDYQLVEEQDVHGLPRYTLLVSPEVGPVEDKLLVSALLEELGKMKGAYHLMAGIWSRADIIQVKREQPRPTPRGKILPFRALGSV